MTKGFSNQDIFQWETWDMDSSTELNMVRSSFPAQQSGTRMMWNIILRCFYIH